MGTALLAPKQPLQAWAHAIGLAFHPFQLLNRGLKESGLDLPGKEHV